MCIRGWWVKLFFCLLLCVTVQKVSAQTNSAPKRPDYEILNYPRGALLNFKRGDVAFSESKTPPVTGWEHRDVEAVSMFEEAYRRVPGHKLVFWVKLRFPREALGNGPQVLGTDHTSDRFIVFLNGVDVYRTFADENDRQFNWNRPRIAGLPEGLLRPGMNEVAIRIDTGVAYNLRLGAARIGPFAVLQSSYDWRYFWRIQGPQTINGILLVLTIGVLLFWLVRRKEREFGWLVLVGCLWIFRNLHYYVAAPPFDAKLFWELTVHSMFGLMIALYGFAATFLDIPNRNRTISGFIAAGVLIALMRLIEVQQQVTDLISYLLTLPLAFLVIWIFLKQVLAKPRVESSLMLGALTTSIGFSVHDLGLMAQWWRGTTIYLQPYSSLLVYSAFAFALGRRVLVALDTVENLNITLESRVANATAELARSEAARHKLEMESAIEQERERMMREIHDGIGSNLVTALGAAERQRASSETVAVLRRSITDLKIAVDSLEPIDGDVAALLASFRHRLEPELNDAGLSFKWDVEVVPQLVWLDAVNALHVFRILQEAVANIVKHSGATTISVGCKEEIRGDWNGVLISLSDNGKGFDPSKTSNGRGLANMASRAQSLHGVFSCEGQPGSGAKILLWLPVVR
jgi:signal transduction histidine kinase